MKIIDQFPHNVRVIENCWIPMSDECHLAARIWLPADAETIPAPRDPEYIPYRKRDFTRARTRPMHHYFAGHGLPPCESTLEAQAIRTVFCWTNTCNRSRTTLRSNPLDPEQSWCSGALA